MMNVKADKEFDLNFKVNVEGSEETPEVRFAFMMPNGVNVSFPGKYTKDEMVEVSLPSLESLGLFRETSAVNAKLEVIIEGNYFVPWKDTIGIRHPVRVSAESVEYDNQETLDEAATAVSSGPTITYKESDEEKFSPAERLKKVKRDKKGFFTEEIVNGVLYRKYK